MNNEGNRWILTFIEVLSRYAFTEPIETKSGEDTSKAMKEILERFKEKFEKYPDAVQFDDGNEFNNEDVHDMLDNLGIKYFQQ